MPGSNHGKRDTGGDKGGSCNGSRGSKNKENKWAMWGEVILIQRVGLSCASDNYSSMT